MFGGDMMAKLQAMQQQMEESKKRLETITVEGSSADGRVKVIATGNRKIREVSIDASLMEDKEELEDTLLVALNRALENADQVWESEMQGAAGQMLF